MALRATIREFMNGVAQAKQAIALDKPEIRIGRSLNCDVQIGGALDSLSAGRISRVQATITVAEDGEAYLVDGTPEQRSSNRVWHNSSPVDTPTRLVPGAEFTLYKSGEAMVQLLIEGPLDASQETYTGNLLLEAFEEKLEALTDQVDRMQEQNVQMQQQIDKLSLQLAERGQTDQQQTQLITDLDRRLRKAVSGALIAFAVALVAFTLSSDLSAEERGEWRKTLVQIVQVVAGVAVAGVGVKLNLADSKPGEAKGQG